jgi:cytochrome c biogenesis protein CcmG/thiol:disulfide interchange protein DsbE
METPHRRTSETGLQVDEATMIGKRRSALAPARAALAVAALCVASTGWPLDVGESVPAFVLPTAGGEIFELRTLSGRVVYVDFWASWCGPCRRSFPWMNDMQRKYGARGFTVVGVNVDKRQADAERFLQQTPAAFTVVYDEAGKTPTAYSVTGMPSSYLIDRTGRLIAIERGFRDEQKGRLEVRIRALLPPE